MELELHTVPDGKTAAKEAAHTLENLVTGYTGHDVLLLFSGGSPLEILKHLSSTVFGAGITVGMSDERWDHDPLINNFAQIIASPWYEAVSQKGATHIDTRKGEEQTVQEAGVRFDRMLKEWKVNHPAGKIILTQGIGLDGHTVGMMPYPEDAKTFASLFEDESVWAVGYDAKAKNKYPLRVTTTVPFLKMVDDSILFVCGADKKEPLARVLASSGSLAQTPGRIIHQMKHCLLFTDLPV